MKKLLFLLFFVSNISLGQIPQGYSLVGKIEMPENGFKIYKRPIITAVHITPNEEYLILDVGFKPSVYVVYDASNFEYVDIFKFPGFVYPSILYYDHRFDWFLAYKDFRKKITYEYKVGSGKYLKNKFLDPRGEFKCTVIDKKNGLFYKSYYFDIRTQVMRVYKRVNN